MHRATAQPIKDSISQSDQACIGRVLGRLREGFIQRDASLIDGIYSADADWTNAFGRRLVGNQAIVAYLAELFADPNFTEGALVGEPEVVVRDAGRDAVAVGIYTEIFGQRTVGGGVLQTRRNYSLKVIARQADGEWQIVADMYMDARDEVTHQRAQTTE